MEYLRGMSRNCDSPPPLALLTHDNRRDKGGFCDPSPPPEGHVYEMLLFEEKEIEGYVSRMVDVDNGIYDCVEVESEVEREFAETMSKRSDIKLVIKLPDWFKVETPIGTYNPDWAIVKHQDEKLYLVRETKSTKEHAKLRQSEWDKIRCGKAHFHSLEVNFDHVTSAADV